METAYIHSKFTRIVLYVQILNFHKTMFLACSWQRGQG